MIRLPGTALLALAACSQLGMNSSGGQSASGGASQARAAPQDAKFMENMAQAHLAEIEAGKLALTKAQSGTVRQFGQLMIEEHSAMLNEAGRLATAKGMPVPTSPDVKHQAAIKKLELASGPNFDRSYMQEMVKDHAETLELLKQASTQAVDPQLRAHVEKVMPHVQQHLALARRIAGDLVGRATDEGQTAL